MINKVGIKGNFLNRIQGIYETSTLDIILNGERLNGFPLKSGGEKDVHCHYLCLTLYWSFHAGQLSEGQREREREVEGERERRKRKEGREVWRKKRRREEGRKEGRKEGR